MYGNLLKDGRIVIEFGGKGNVESIVNSIKSKLLIRGYENQSKLNPWFFPSIGQYCTALEKVGFSVAYARHYDRPTKLADKENGIIDWIKMFGKVFFLNVEQSDIEEISKEVQDELRPILYKENDWFADYKRIRIIAYKRD